MIAKKFKVWDPISKCFWNIKSSWCITPDGKVAISNTLPLTCDEAILIQYIGIEDKNNVEIYEWYILEINYKVLSDIITEKYDDQKTICKVIPTKRGWGLERISGFEREFRMGFESPDSFEFHPEDSKIIGNIFENPELLK